MAWAPTVSVPYSTPRLYGAAGALRAPPGASGSPRASEGLPQSPPSASRRASARSRPRAGSKNRIDDDDDGPSGLRDDPRGWKKKNPHKHQLSEVRADFLDRRWAPLAAPPAPPLARSARQGGRGSSADPGYPRGPPKVYVYDVSFSFDSRDAGRGGGRGPGQPNSK